MLMTSRQLRLSIALLVLPSLLSFGCSREPATASRFKTAADVLDVRPVATDTIAAQLQRFSGQTQFLNAERASNTHEDAESAEKAPASSSTKREIQEADLFKLGLPGSKLLYVLNNYRGLQVIDFREGPASPQILGHAAATGAELVEMYFAAELMQIIVLERSWDMTRQQHQGRLLVYTVQDPRRPKLIQRIETQGDIADSRLVGSVLYVASRRQLQQEKGEGWVQSFRLNQIGLQEFSSYRLAMPVTERKNMNIIESMEGGRTQYYLISVLEQNFFAWVGRQSAIEVIDITDPDGAIKPLLNVSVKGELLERSATTIKDHTLIAVSSSWIQDKEGRSIRTVSVESFALPLTESPLIDPSEAEFRRLWWERQMKNAPADVDKDAYGEQLKSDPKFGLKGVFVKQDDGRVVKLFPDQTVTVGDDTGQHASLQDVRFVGDRLYVFWVPANQVDPLDIFDISRPSKAVRYLGRTLFPGWMERAIPLNWEGREYILALGWIVPTTGEDRGRLPQVMIFAIHPEDSAGLVTSVAQLTLEKSQVLAFFNDEDKSIEVNMQADGRGSIMFPARTTKGDTLSGGKLVYYDLKATAPKLREGGFLAADVEWLRRVFTNPEIDRIHTLTDRSLGTFDLGTQEFTRPEQIMTAVSTLELARDIVAYTRLPIGRELYGMQIIDNGAARNEDIKTVLRLVKADWADAERGQVQVELALPGRYEAHLMSTDGSLYVRTQRFLGTADNPWASVIELSRVRWALNTSTQNLAPLVETLSLPNQRSKLQSFSRSQPALFDLGNGRILLAQDRSLSLVNSSGELSVADLSDSLQCLPERAENIRYVRLHEQLYVGYGLPVKSDEAAYRGLRLMRYFMAPFTEGTLQLQCQAAVNIPGQPVSRDGQALVTEDRRFLGFATLASEHAVKEQAQVASVDVLSALKLQSGLAQLRDIYSLSQAMSRMHDAATGITVLEKQDSVPAAVLVELGLDAEQQFTRRSFALPMQAGERDGLTLLKVLPASPEQDMGRLYILGSYTGSWQLFEARNDRLRLRQVAALLRPQERSEPMQSFDLFGWFAYLSDAEREARIVYEPEFGRLSFARGLWGMQQYAIVAEGE